MVPCSVARERTRRIAAVRELLVGRHGPDAGSEFRVTGISLGGGVWVPGGGGEIGCYGLWWLGYGIGVGGVTYGEVA